MLSNYDDDAKMMNIIIVHVNSVRDNDDDADDLRTIMITMGHMYAPLLTLIRHWII